jgi:hypothetical protein
VGTYLKRRSSTCAKVTGFTVIKTNEVGLSVTGNVARLEVTNIIAADNMVGLNVRNSLPPCCFIFPYTLNSTFC